MNFSSIKELYKNTGLDKLEKQERRQVLDNTFKWWFGYEDRLKEEVEKILIKREKTNHNKKESDKKDELMNHGTFQLPSEDSDEYIPKDMEMGESMLEASHSFEISPFLEGYYTGGKKSYFDKSRLIWSKRKKLQDFQFSIPDRDLSNKRRYNFSGKIGKGIFSIPIPVGSFPITHTLVSNIDGLKFKIDQNYQIYLESNSVGEFSFDFYKDLYKNNINPIKEDSEKIINGKLSDQTNNLLISFKNSGKTDIDIASELSQYINKGKKYNEKAQGETFNSSNKNNYFEKLDNAKSLECYSSNTLFVGLLRELGIKSRLIVGHYVNQKGKNGKSNIGQNTGHAWSEVWDEDNNTWIRFDATPLVRENQENQELNGEQDNNDSDKNGGEDNKNNGQRGSYNNKDFLEEEIRSPQEILDEMIEKVREDDYKKQEDKLNEDLQKVSDLEDKNDLKELKGNTDLTKKAKEILDEEVNRKILDKEKEEIKDLKDEKQIEEKLKNSFLDDDQFKLKLIDYAKILKEKIEKEKKKKESKMKNYGFSKEELSLYEEYIKLEKEVENEIKKNIKKLENLLPKEYKIVEDESRYFSGKSIDKSKLVNYKLTGDTRVFKRNMEEIKDIKVNMFEVILIDRSGSMGSFDDPDSPFRNAVKAAIIRAKTLEHFKVDFSIVFFDSDIEEIMTFGEKFSSKKTMIPAKLMRALRKSGGTNISDPIIYTKEKLTQHLKKVGTKYLANITFIGDGEPGSGLTGDSLKYLIDDTKKKFPITAFYINEWEYGGSGLEKYFGNKESGGTVIIDNVSELSKAIVDTFNKNIKKTLNKINRIK